MISLKRNYRCVFRCIYSSAGGTGSLVGPKGGRGKSALTGFFKREIVCGYYLWVIARAMLARLTEVQNKMSRGKLRYREGCDVSHTAALMTSVV